MSSNSTKQKESVNSAAIIPAAITPNRTSLFTVESLRHIFYGTVYKYGKRKNWRAGGYHHESESYKHEKHKRSTYIIKSTRAAPDDAGIYAAYVVICGMRKKNVSYFFPRDWTKAQVLQAIREAYPSLIRIRLARNLVVWHTGQTKQGMRIKLAIDPDGYVRTAFPLPQSKKWHSINPVTAHWALTEQEQRLYPYSRRIEASAVSS